MSVFESIDEKLDEIKFAVMQPDYTGILAGFEWSRKWFASIEEVLLKLAYRGESDKIVLDFIRAKIIDTDVLTFNDILRDQFNVAPIRNHYQIMLDDCENKWKKDPEILLLTNRNTKIVDYILKNRIKSLESIQEHLSLCQSNIAVDYLIANPDKINWNDFPLNNNVNAIKYSISRGIYDIDMFAAVDDDEIADFLIENSSREWPLYSPFGTNPNNKVVDYMLSHVNDMDHDALSINPNDKVVDYLLANPDKIAYYRFVRNTNDRAIEYVLANPNKIEWKHFMDNSNDKAVDHILANIDNIKKWELFEIFWNDNDRIMDYILSNMEYDIYQLNHNACNYNRQKLAKFNELQLFPQIPHLNL